MSELPTIDGLAELLDGPHRDGNAQRWRVRLVDGRAAVLSQLLPELADDEALRRRFVLDAERVRDVGAASLAPVLATGPMPDPRDQAAAPPWLLRLDPPGETLEAWLLRRAPAPLDEAAALAARIADALTELHRRGAVVRNLHPRRVVLGDDGRIWLTDVGLARTDILTTRTAASLLLEGSPYAAPEHLTATIVDPRADLFGLGVLLWRALTGALPFGEAPPIFREETALPTLASVRPSDADAPGLAALDAAVRACLAWDPARRPRCADDVAAALRGERPLPGHDLARVACQACGAAMRPGLRLCLACGKTAVQFGRAQPGQPRFAVDLRRATDDDAFARKLRGFLEAVADGDVPPLNFLTGDARWYSKAERKTKLKLPARLIGECDEATANALVERLRADGFKVKAASIEGSARIRTGATVAIIAGVCGFIMSVPVFAAGSLWVGLALVAGGAVGVIGGAQTRARAKPADAPALVSLRRAPAALPARDALVARIADALTGTSSPEVRSVVEQLAVSVQRLVDDRASRAHDDAEHARVAQPVAPLVELVVAQVEALERVDRELGELDEGALVRALAASEARDEPATARAAMLAGLDRLRVLEDQRCQHLARLFEAASLLSRAVELALAAGDDDRDAARALVLAQAALEDVG